MFLVNYKYLYECIAEVIQDYVKILITARNKVSER